MKVKVKKLHPDAVIPSYAKAGDGAMDLTAVSLTFTEGRTRKAMYDTGLAFEIPYGYVGLVFPRSSISKKELLLSNSVGVIDAGYRGSVKLCFALNDHTMLADMYDIGDRIGQIMIVPRPEIEFEEVSELSESERGDGAFGHTGKGA